MKETITVLDLGSSKIAGACAEMDRKGNTNILALENLDSQGITNGNITDMNKAVESVFSIMEKLNKTRKTKNIFIATKGSDIEMRLSKGMVALSKVPREITKKDMAKCLEIASMIKIPLKRSIVEKVVKCFTIDETLPSVENPIGLYGMKLEGEVCIATVNQSKIENITKCIDHAGFILDGIYLSGVASSGGVLDDEEKEKGVLLLDIGDSLTEAIVFKSRILQDFFIINSGVTDILDDVNKVDKQDLTSFLEKINKLVKKRDNRFSSVVITGGGAILEGVIEEAEKVLNKKTKIGIVRSVDHKISSKNAVIHTATLGLIRNLAKEHGLIHVKKGPIQKAIHKLQHIYETYF